MTEKVDISDKLHRLVKSVIDSGKADSVADAEALFQRYTVGLTIDADAATEPAHQSALLTAVALGRRVFLGGVSVEGAVNAPLLSPITQSTTLGKAVLALGGRVARIGNDVPRITIGGNPIQEASRFHVRTGQGGWCGGVCPAAMDVEPEGHTDMPLAAMLAAALAVNECFLYVSGEGRVAGRRAVGLSLWQPSPDVDWLTAGAEEPPLEFLPSRLWLIGLGHLGQAYLWALGLLPFAEPGDVSLVLQDIDAITPSTESTSLLSSATMVGRMKTRVLAEWAERRGFRAVIHERLFDDSFLRQENEPAVALCGLDNALGRRALDRVGFDLVVEAGLGHGYRDFRNIRLHTLPGTRSAADIWKLPRSGEEVTHRAAYRKLLADGVLDQCGMTQLAGKAVGGCFVGATAACLVLAEVLRLLHGGPAYSLIDVDLADVEHRTAVLGNVAWTGINPGFVLANVAETAYAGSGAVGRPERNAVHATSDP